MRVESHRPVVRSLAFFCLLVLAALPREARAQSYTFEHFAGSLGGPGNLDLPGSAARFHWPWGIARDTAGNLYVTEGFSGTLRLIDGSGQVFTLAGSASGPTFGFEGRRADIQFSNPRHLTIDSAGNLYVADGSSHTIRKVTPGGVVTTFAGMQGEPGTANGTGSAARFNFPSGIAYHAGPGTFYVADHDSHTIRKITSAGAVTTFAGLAGTSGSADGTGSAARFLRPEAVATDSAGNVYVADTDNHTIRKITPGGAVTTLAGLAGSAGFVNDTGGAARFNAPYGLVVDGSGNVYVADRGNHVIRKVTAAGVVTTFAGSGNIGHVDDNFLVATFNQPTGITIDGSGNLYVAEVGNNAVRKIVPSGPVTTLAGKGHVRGANNGFGAAAQFREPRGVAADGSGNLFVVDQTNHLIRKIDPATAQVTTFAGSGSAGYANGTGTAAQFYFPRGISVDGSGNLYVADYSAHTIRKITAAAVVTTLAGSGGSSGTTNGTGSAARFNLPYDTAVDPSGNVYVADYGNHAIRKITPGGSVSTLAGLPGTYGSVNGTGTAARFYYPAGVAVDGSGNVYVADSYNHAIRKVTPAGVVTTFAGEIGQIGYDDGTGTAARFYSPEAIAIDSSGNLWVADASSTRIRRITPAAVVTTIAGKLQAAAHEDGTGEFARFTRISGIAVDSSGRIWVSDSDVSAIRRGRPALDAAAAIDSGTGPTGVPRQLSTTNAGSVTAWQWNLIRRPAGSSASLSSTSVASPTFTPDVPDVYVFRLDAAGVTTTSITQVSLTAECPPVSVGPVSLPHPIAGVAYSESVSAGGGTGPYTFSIAEGSLPPGLAISTSGTISGTSSTPGDYTFRVRAIDQYGCPGEREYTLTVGTLPAPTGLVATGSSANVALTWNSVGGASGYRIYRRDYLSGGYAAVGTSATPSFTDTMITSFRAYAYRVRAYDGSGIESGDSNTDFTATYTFDTVAPGTVIYAAHLHQLRQIVIEGRYIAGLEYGVFTDPDLTGAPIKAVHVTELRSGIDDIRAALGMSTVSFTDASLAGVAVKALHVTQMQNAVK